VVFSCLFTAGAPAPQGSLMRDDETPLTAAVPQGTLLRDEDNIDAFKKAIEQEKSTATLAKSAKTETEWKIVASGWNKGIELMKTVPKTNPNYAKAQPKIVDYQKNLAAIIPTLF